MRQKKSDFSLRAAQVARANAHRIAPVKPVVERPAYVASVRQDVKSGEYETDEKLDTAVVRLLDVLNKEEAA